MRERDIETNDFFAGSAFFESSIEAADVVGFYTITKGDVMVRRFCGQMFFCYCFSDFGRRGVSA